jgi:hypothetical protein
VKIIFILLLVVISFGKDFNTDLSKLDSLKNILYKLEIAEKANTVGDSMNVTINSLQLAYKIASIRLQIEQIRSRNPEIVNKSEVNGFLISKAGSKIKYSVLASVSASLLSTTALMADTQGAAIGLSIGAIVCSIFSIQQLWSAGNDLEKSSSR